MANDFTRSINEGLDRLIPVAMNLRDCIENFGTKESNELSDKIGIKIKTLIANYLRRRYPYLISVTGPQGTGKSHLVNELLAIPEEARLLSSEPRCERVPVIVTFLKEGDDPNNPVTKVELIDSGTIDNNNNQGHNKEIVMYWQQSDMSYEDAREKVIEDDGILYIWRIPYQKNLMSFKIRNEEEIQSVPIDDNFAMLVLPGIEDGERWSEFAKQSLLTADAVIFVIDHPRYAQSVGHQLIKYINDNHFDKPIVAVSYADTLRDKKNEFKQTIQKEWEIEHICLVDLPKTGIEEIGTAVVDLLKNGHENTCNYTRFKNYLRSFRNDLKEAKKIIAENNGGTYNTTLEDLVEYIMGKYQEAREYQENIILTKINTIIEEHTNTCKNDKEIDRIIDTMGGETGWRRFWIGIVGPEVENIRTAEKMFSNLWSEGSTSSENRELIGNIAKEIKLISDDDKKIEEKALAIVDLIMENKNSLSYKIANAITKWSEDSLEELNTIVEGVEVMPKGLTSLFERSIAVSFSNNPEPYKINLQQVFSESKKINDEIREYFGDDINFLKGYSKSVNKYINKDMMKSIKKAKTGFASSPTAKGVGTAILTTAASLPGGIIIAEMALISVAGLGAFYIAHLAGLRRRDIQVYDMIKENLDYVKESTKDNIKKNLRFYIDTIEYNYKKTLEESLGIDDHINKNLNLAMAVKLSENRVNEVINMIDRL